MGCLTLKEFFKSEFLRLAFTIEKKHTNSALNISIDQWLYNNDKEIL